MARELVRGAAEDQLAPDDEAVDDRALGVAGGHVAARRQCGLRRPGAVEERQHRNLDVAVVAAEDLSLTDGLAHPPGRPWWAHAAAAALEHLSQLGLREREPPRARRRAAVGLEGTAIERVADGLRK